MKSKFISTIISFVLISTSHSQITKGNWILGGTISFSSTSYSSQNFGPPHTAQYFNISPSAGFFIAEKFCIGIKTSLKKTVEKGTFLRYTNFNGGAFSRYYLLPKEKRVNVVTEACYQFGFEKGSVPGITPKNTIALSGGPVIFLNNSVAMEFLLDYSSEKYTKHDGRNNTVLFGIGLQVYLEKDK